jgi:hypothetical protein
MGAEPSIELILQGDVKVHWCEETLVAGRGFLSHYHLKSLRRQP